jgi:alkylation response protein AidB-like acyl-CoA dehydrogenase
LPEEYGGLGVDRLFSVVMIEEAARLNATGLGFTLHSDIVANYIKNFGTDDQKKKWLPRMATGEVVGAIAMTEPGTGSDLQAIKTTAVKEGDDYVINGSKTFITNGYQADLIVLVAKTGTSEKGHENISLILVEANTPGFTKGKPLKKVGMKAQDTCELFLENVKVPQSNLMGKEGGGFIALMKELAWERIILGVGAIASADAALNLTIEYTKSRKVFGKPVADYQNSRFKLAEMKSEIAIGQVYVDKCLELVSANKLSPEVAAVAKYWCTELQCKVIDQCVQLHGGYGFMLEYPIAKFWIDSRGQRIYGGTNEIMREIVARTI